MKKWIFVKSDFQPHRPTTRWDYGYWSEIFSDLQPHRPITGQKSFYSIPNNFIFKIFLILCMESEF
jgi:hypothetical protein